jgi:hypothetical protein
VRVWFGGVMVVLGFGVIWVLAGQGAVGVAVLLC